MELCNNSTIIRNLFYLYLNIVIFYPFGPYTPRFICKIYICVYVCMQNLFHTIYATIE